MSTITGCPSCAQPLIRGSKFCANCGNDISGVWSADPVLATTTVELDPKSDAVSQLLTAATLGEYDVYGELGRGGMAAVYLALDLSLNRKVAIKTMLPELTARDDMVVRFKREAQTAAGLNHPHIIQIYAVRQVPDLVFFIMKFVEGRSLESIIRETGKVSLAMAQTIMSQVGSALDYAHRRHVVHRDIKPANIMIDENGAAIVTDFGIAKVQEAQNLTVTGAAMGTPHYMSPEHIHNAEVSGKSDQYSLGILLYEMLTGTRPFDGRTYAELITQHLFDDPPDVREVSPEVPEHMAAVIRRMLAKAPADRFDSLDDVTHALGSPVSKQDGDLVKSQMITLARSGPQKKLRVSVPMSPVPITKNLQGAKGRAAAAQRGSPAVAPRVGRARQWIGALVLTALLGGGGYVGYGTWVTATPATDPPVSLQSSAPAIPGGQSSESAATAVEDSAALAKAMEDSLRILAQRRYDDSVRIARASARRVADSIAARRKADSILAKRITDSITLAQRVTDSLRQATAQREQDQRSGGTAANPAGQGEAATAQATIGSRTPAAALFVNGRAQGLLTSSVRGFTIPANSLVHLKVTASNCQPWDTTFVPQAGTTHIIGRRNLTCTSP
ncbi:MAG TPA: protein kinase [Gemmatimonadaceae bacterium]|nr:protein kinase [Gemmatimonadaceae bacterium]